MDVLTLPMANPPHDIVKPIVGSRLQKQNLRVTPE